MPIVLNCPGCGKRYDVDRALAGKKSRCKQCGEVFQIPANGGADTSAPARRGQTGERSNAAAGVSSSPGRAASTWESILANDRASAADTGSSPAPGARRQQVKPPAGTIVMNCPGCRKRYELPGDLAGKKSRCGQCGEVFAIPVPRTGAREPELVTMEPEPAASSARPAQPAAESYWESVLADDAGAPKENGGTRQPDYDDFRPPTAPRPAATGRGLGKLQVSDAGDTTLGVKVSGWFIVALLVLFGGAYGGGAIGLLAQNQVRMVYASGFLLTMIGCGSLMIWGAVWLLVVVFREEVRCGIMFLVVPFYGFYYVLTRMAQTKGPASMVLTAYGVIAVVATVGPALERQSRLEAPDNQAAGIAAAMAGRAQPPGAVPSNPAADGIMGPRGNRNPFGPRARRGPQARRSPRSGPPGQFPDAPGRQDASPEFVADGPGLPHEPSVATRRPDGTSPEFPADADPITRSLIQLKMADIGQKKDAIHRLERTTPDSRLGEVVAALLPLLNSDDGFLVHDVIKALTVWRSPDVLPALIERARDNRFFVRKEAVKALGKFQDARAVEAIIGQFEEDGFEAEAALKEIGPMAEPALIARLKDPDPRVRSRACDILKQIGGMETLKAMQAIPPDPDFGVRMAAKRASAQIMARVGPPPPLPGAKKGGASSKSPGLSGKPK
ncbi:MAG: HEAT repeat domain-containing protein [Isosphaeraceae bacterium]